MPIRTYITSFNTDNNLLQNLQCYSKSSFNSKSQSKTQNICEYGPRIYVMYITIVYSGVLNKLHTSKDHFTKTLFQSCI